MQVLQFITGLQLVPLYAAPIMILMPPPNPITLSPVTLSQPTSPVVAAVTSASLMVTPAFPQLPRNITDMPIHDDVLPPLDPSAVRHSPLPLKFSLQQLAAQLPEWSCLEATEPVSPPTPPGTACPFRISHLR